MRYKGGVSLIILIITIIVMTILTTIVVVNSGSIFGDTNKSKLKTEIAQLEALMDTYLTRKNGNLDFNVNNFNIATLTTDEINQFNGETIVNDEIELFVVDLDKIDAEEVSYGNLKKGENDRYLYSNTTKKIYYEKGLIIDSVRYFRISE